MSQTIKPRELHGAKLFGYSIGHFGFFLTRILISVFAFQFYVYTINLDSILASIGISINLLINATSIIIFGVMADKKKPGRFGKRRPFLLFGLPIWFITAILIWFPPWKCPKNNPFYWPTAIYFWTILFINVISGSCIISAHIAMLPEQSQTYINREKVASWRAVSMIIASILALMLPLMVESILDDPENVKWWQPSGKIILFYMPIIGISFATFGLMSLLFTYFSVDESFHKISSPMESEKLTLKETFQRMAIPAKDKKFRKFLGVAYFNAMASRILGVLIIPFLTYSLLFRGTDYLLYVLVSILGKFGWFFIWKKFLKKHALMKTYSLCILSAIIVAPLELFFLVNVLSYELKIVLFVITIGTILGAMYGLNLFTAPLASALIYESALKNGDENVDENVSNLSGSYFGLHSFTLAIGQAISTFMVGLILTGPNEDNPIIITVTLSSMGLFYIISLLFLRKIKLERYDS